MAVGGQMAAVGAGACAALTTCRPSTHSSRAPGVLDTGDAVHTRQQQCHPEGNQEEHCEQDGAGDPPQHARAQGRPRTPAPTAAQRMCIIAVKTLPAAGRVEASFGSEGEVWFRASTGAAHLWREQRRIVRERKGGGGGWLVQAGKSGTRLATLPPPAHAPAQHVLPAGGRRGMQGAPHSPVFSLGTEASSPVSPVTSIVDVRTVSGRGDGVTLKQREGLRDPTQACQCRTSPAWRRAPAELTVATLVQFRYATAGRPPSDAGPPSERPGTAALHLPSVHLGLQPLTGRLRSPRSSRQQHGSSPPQQAGDRCRHRRRACRLAAGCGRAARAGDCCIARCGRRAGCLLQGEGRLHTSAVQPAKLLAAAAGSASPTCPRATGRA